MKWVSLHSHTAMGSFKDGYGNPEDHVARAVELGMPALALTEHGRMTSHPRLEQSAKAAGIKPIYGLEAYFLPSSRMDQRAKHHLTLLAENERGYQNLIALVSRSHAEGKHFLPTINEMMLSEHSDGVIALSGCLHGILACSVVGGKGMEPAPYKRSRNIVRQFAGIMGDRFYLEVQAIPELDATKRVNEVVNQLSVDLGIPTVATCDVHYPYPEQAEMQRILHRVRGQGGQDDDFEHDGRLSYPSTDRRLLERLVGAGCDLLQAKRAARGAVDLSERVQSFDLPRMPMVRFPGSAGHALDTYRQWLKEGWQARGFHKLSQHERDRYRERVRYETEIIRGKGFLDYFLVVAEIVRHARSVGVLVGPGRGSAAGSLVCHLLGITEVNPMLFDSLIFERFIDVSRDDQPDIDIDFDDRERHKVWEFAVQRYGPERVALMANLVTFQGRSALDAIARAYDTPGLFGAVEEIKRFLGDSAEGSEERGHTIELVHDLPSVADLFERYPELEHAKTLEGTYSSDAGVHAGALIIGSQPIGTVAPVEVRSPGKRGDDRPVVALDKRDCEYLGLLKIDTLGISTLGSIVQTCRYAGVDPASLYNLDLNDAEVLDGFRRADVVGIFQFTGHALRMLCEKMRPSTFQEIADANALVRPGPRDSGGTDAYIEVKLRLRKRERVHPIYDDITSDTYGQLVYQEQMIRMCREIGGFDWPDANAVRRAIGKKKGAAEINKYRERFRDGAFKHGLAPIEADALWDRIITAGKYAFNAAHAVSYAYLAYWTMWLKVHYPVEFYAGALEKAADRTEVQMLLRDAARHGIKVAGIHPTKSGATWQPEGSDVLRAGFTEIEGIGDKIAERIIETRQEHWGVEELALVPGVGPKTVAKIRDAAEAQDPYGTRLLFNVAGVRRSMQEREGGYPHPTHTAIEVPARTTKNIEVVWVGVITAPPKQWDDEQGGKTLYLDGEDDTGRLRIKIHPRDYARLKPILGLFKRSENYLLVRGTKYNLGDRRSINAHDLYVITPRRRTRDENETTTPAQDAPAQPSDGVASADA